MYKNILLTLLCTIPVLIACNKTPTDLTKASLIPKPLSITATGSNFVLSKGSGIFVLNKSKELEEIGYYLSTLIKPATGFDLKVTPATEISESGNIYLAISDEDQTLGLEGYDLAISEDMIVLKAKNVTGVFRGIQTIRQLLPAKIELPNKQDVAWNIPTGTIRDHPNYEYRGVMLDVSRHFFGVTEVKHFIDMIALYKINVLHLHLSDDQGWRIEIKSWPKLATYGGSTKLGGGKGGYYTQADFKEIVKYAQTRYITIVPEIDIPGHTNAALASYPELNYNGKSPALYIGSNVGFSTLYAQKDITYKFIDDVVRELAAITPGPYIHIGGDESHATKKEDYITIIKKVQDIVRSHGKQMIGWDEISQASLTPNTIAQYWANEAYAKSAKEQGAKLIVSPAKKTYLDMSYDSTSKLGLHWAAYIEVDFAYDWDPASCTPGITKENILGIEAPLWTETITNMDEIEYMVFPRLLGYAEIGWTPVTLRRWEEYKVRLANHGERLKNLDINFYRSKQVQWTN